MGHKLQAACSLAACLSAPYLNHFPQIHLLCPQLHRKQLGDKGGEVVQCICPPITSPYQSLYKEKMGEGQVPLTSQTEATLLIKTGRSHKPESYSLPLSLPSSYRYTRRYILLPPNTPFTLSSS